MGEMLLSVVVLEGESPDDAARTVAGRWADEVRWAIEVPGSSGGWPDVTYYGPEWALGKIRERYNQLGKPHGPGSKG